MRLPLLKPSRVLVKKRTRIQTLGEHPIRLAMETTYYPDGSEVKQGHMCTERKALEYVLKEINVISHELDKLNLGLLDSMKEALISFIHSVGWEAFSIQRIN